MDYEFPAAYRRFGNQSYGIIVPAIEDCFIEDAVSLEEAITEAKSIILAFLGRLSRQDALPQLAIEPIDALAENSAYLDYMWMTIRIGEADLARLPSSLRLDLPHNLIGQVRKNAGKLGISESQFVEKILQDFFRVDLSDTLNGIGFSNKPDPLRAN